MVWVRIDDGFMEHPKVTALTPREFQVVMRALCYAGRRRDPHIAATTLQLLLARKTDPERFVALGLWDLNGDGWVIHDWTEYQAATSTERVRDWRRGKQNETK